MIDLDPEFGPTLQTSGGEVEVNGMTEVGDLAHSRGVHLGLAFLQPREDLPGSSCVESELTEQGGVRETRR